MIYLTVTRPEYTHMSSFNIAVVPLPHSGFYGDTAFLVGSCLKREAYTGTYPFQNHFIIKINAKQAYTINTFTIYL